MENVPPPAWWRNPTVIAAIIGAIAAIVELGPKSQASDTKLKQTTTIHQTTSSLGSHVIVQAGSDVTITMEQSKEALKVIGDFANRLCQTVPFDTRSDKLQLSGTAKAELEGIIKKLANLGISGAAKYESLSSQNVLQKDLAEVLNESRNCRLQIWNDLKDKFQIGSPANNQPTRPTQSGAKLEVKQLDDSCRYHNSGFCGLHMLVRWENVPTNSGYYIYAVGHAPDYGNPYWIAGTGIKVSTFSTGHIFSAK